MNNLEHFQAQLKRTNEQLAALRLIYTEVLEKIAELDKFLCARYSAFVFCTFLLPCSNLQTVCSDFQKSFFTFSLFICKIETDNLVSSGGHNYER